MLVSLHPRFAVHRFAGPAIALGSVVFSGSIFALVVNRDKYASPVANSRHPVTNDKLRFKWLGPITPLGGTIMMAG